MIVVAKKYMNDIPMTCIGLHGSFTRIFSSPTAFAMTQRTVSGPSSAKKERKNDMTQNKKLELF